jgi:hypothetical protein
VRGASRPAVRRQRWRPLDVRPPIAPSTTTAPSLLPRRPDRCTSAPRISLGGLQPLADVDRCKRPDLLRLLPGGGRAVKVGGTLLPQPTGQRPGLAPGARKSVRLSSPRCLSLARRTGLEVVIARNPTWRLSWPTRCVGCNAALPVPRHWGNRRIWCSEACRVRAWHDRRAEAEGRVRRRRRRPIRINLTPRSNP